ncbi:hypothetical protein RJT34_24934 [Clitoria ternatea]|uniref:Uncharacterized protein n=1 Tax=Clitoria ternatea TaxID=43366 RepID=A0AAN9FP48_CLITE
MVDEGVIHDDMLGDQVSDTIAVDDNLDALTCDFFAWFNYKEDVVVEPEPDEEEDPFEEWVTVISTKMSKMEMELHMMRTKIKNEIKKGLTSIEAEVFKNAAMTKYKVKRNKDFIQAEMLKAVSMIEGKLKKN